MDRNLWGRAASLVGISVAGVITAGLSVQALSAQSAPAPGGGLPAGEGRDTVERACSTCHSVGMATAQRHDAGGWKEVVDAMINRGAQVDDEQSKIIVAYFSKNFAPSQSQPMPMGLPTPSTEVLYERPSGENRWPAYGGGGFNQNFSELTQITSQNVKQLKQVWVYHYGTGRANEGSAGLNSSFQVTPLIIGDLMYISTPRNPRNPDLKSSVTALNPMTGEIVWKYESPWNIHGRGLAYWPGDNETAPRLVFGTENGMLVAVDVTTGQPAAGFGRNGAIDIYVGVVSEIVGESRRRTFSIPNPVRIYRNLIITGARPGEMGPPGPRGDIRAFDVRTGRLVWDFHVVPQPGEPNFDPNGEWQDVTGANTWSVMALDEENGIVFAPAADHNSHSPGAQLYSDSLIALDAETGKMRWFRQITHRDIWDWDMAVPPILFDLDVDGKKLPAVLVTSKHGLIFIFNRLTGEPLNGFTERPTPRPDDPALESLVWPTQPFPDWPATSIARTQMTREEIPDVVPGMRAACQKFWDANEIVSVPLYGLRQSNIHNVISYPSMIGSVNWGGPSYNPNLGLVYFNMHNRAEFRRKITSDAGTGEFNRDSPTVSDTIFDDFTFTTSDGVKLPCGALPWGELVALDLKKKRIAWRSTLGITEELGKRGLHTGTYNLGGSLSTASGLVFIGATKDDRFRAFDGKTGRLLWESKMESGGHAAPITYMGADGKQYVVIAAGGAMIYGGKTSSDSLIAYSLP